MANSPQFEWFEDGRTDILNDDPLTELENELEDIRDENRQRFAARLKQLDEREEALDRQAGTIDGKRRRLEQSRNRLIDTGTSKLRSKIRKTIYERP